MKLIIITGPQASGKMTLWYELSTLTWLKPFHNHMSIDLVSDVVGREYKEFPIIVDNLRKNMIEETSKIPDYPGIIFTMVWGFEYQEDRNFIEEIMRINTDAGWENYIIELECELSERLKRNTHEFRLSQKQSKQDTAHSEALLLQEHEHERVNSLPWEIQYKNYLKFDNTHLSASESAQRILEYFQLKNEK